MTRRTVDPHLRFDAWLLSGAIGEPARDLALHASVCSECVGRIAALDLLTAVDTGRAALPPSVRLIREPAQGLGGLGRYATAFAGVTVATALIGLAGWRLIDLRGLTETANADESTRQAVLGGTGRPSPTPEAQPSESVTSPAESVPQAPSAAPTPVHTAPPPEATPRPATPRPSASASASVSAGPSATPTPAGSPAASPTPVPTDTPTPEPTDTPTPEPTDTPTPEPTATPTPEPTVEPSPTPTP
jgi:hypothetical protein